MPMHTQLGVEEGMDLDIPHPPCSPSPAITESGCSTLIPTSTFDDWQFGHGQVRHADILLAEDNRTFDRVEPITGTTKDVNGGCDVPWTLGEHFSPSSSKVHFQIANVCDRPKDSSDRYPSGSPNLLTGQTALERESGISTPGDTDALTLHAQVNSPETPAPYSTSLDLNGHRVQSSLNHLSHTSSQTSDADNRGPYLTNLVNPNLHPSSSSSSSTVHRPSWPNTVRRHLSPSDRGIDANSETSFVHSLNNNKKVQKLPNNNKDNTDGNRPSSLERRRPSIRPIPIRPISRPGSASRSASSLKAFTPYSIPLPLSAASRSSIPTPFMTPFPVASPASSSVPTQIGSHTAPPIPSTPTKSRIANAYAETSPSGSNLNGTPSPSRGLGSPGGTMSASIASGSNGKRRAPPTFPSPRQNVASHRDLIARSAGLAPLNYAQTPSALRVPPTAEWSPAFGRSGYQNRNNVNRPYKIPVSPGHPLPPQSAGPAPHRRYSSSLSLTSAYGRSRPSTPTVIPTKEGTVKLRNVPVAWVVRELNRQAPRLWHDLESTDCRIVIPCQPSARKQSSATSGVPDSATSLHSNQPGRSYWPPTPVGTVQPCTDFRSGLGRGEQDVISSFRVENQRGRRGSLPESDDQQVMVFKMHQDYLITQSKLFRHLLSSTPAHLDMPVPHRTAIVAGEVPSPITPEGLKGGRVVHTPGGKGVTIIVPIPDPECWGLIAHWLYWGDASVITDALSRGLVSWMGLVQCIDYLDLDNSIKKIVGSWWRRWMKDQNITRGGGGDKWLDDEGDHEGPEGEGSRSDDDTEVGMDMDPSGQRGDFKEDLKDEQIDELVLGALRGL